MKTKLHGIVAMLAIAGSLCWMVSSCAKEEIVPNEENEEPATRAAQGEDGLSCR